MLAYVFWHRPRPHVDPGRYEAALATFHQALAAHSPAGFTGSHRARLEGAPWLGPGPAYEDWYLVADWAAIGRLDEAAVRGPRRAPHDAVALEAGEGAGAVYRRVLGAPHPGGALAQWFAKPDGVGYDELGETLDQRLGARDASLWQRQLLLGPAPEFCLLADDPVDLEPWTVTTVARATLP